MPLPPQLFDVTLNCTNLINMTQQERVTQITTQPVVLIPVIVGFASLVIILFLFGLFTSVGNSKRMLLTLPNYFVVFIFVIIIGVLTIVNLYTGWWILLFI